MGLDIVLEDEQGQQIESITDPLGLLIPLIERDADRTAICLQFIDPYGDTMFNRLQMKQLVSELRNLHKFAVRQEEKDLLREIEILAERGQQEPHRYLKFYGD